MIDYVEVYKKIRPTYERFSERLSDLILTLLAESKIRIHAIEKRAKDVDSFQQKLQKPEKQYDDPLQQITDLCGIRIIVYYVDDLEFVKGLLEKEFTVDVDNSSDRGALLKPNEFGYRSHHYIISLSNNRSELPEWHAFGDIKAEIQVRTVLQHAWASISHALQYKNSEEVPAELSRKLFRVSGLLELADEEFTDIKRHSIEISTNVAQSLGAGNLKIEINGNSLRQYLEKNEVPKKITAIAIKSGFELPEEEDSDELDDIDDDFSDLVWTCSRAGIVAISELNEICINNQEAISKLFKHLIAEDKGRWFGQTPFFIKLLIMYAYPDCFDVKLLVKRRWDKDIAQRVIAAISAQK